MPSLNVTSNKAAVTIEGLEELAMTIRTLKTSGERSAMAAGVKAGMTVVARQIRKEINSQQVDTEHAASLKAGLRKLVGSRFQRGGLDKMKRMKAMVAKVGLAVGKKSDDRMSQGTTATHKRRVGVTRKTAHWFVLGTPNRQPGQVPDLFAGAVGRAAGACGETAMQAAVAKAKQRLERAAARAAAKKR